jgi:predicted nucleic acid-binding Zn ribbon protein
VTAGDAPETGEGRGIDMARAALAAARAAARNRGAERQERRTSGASTRRSGARGDDRDPQLLGRTIARLIAEHGWETPTAVGGIVSRWGEIVGSPIRDHCVPESFDDGVLSIRADSTAWATELRLLAATLLAKLNAELGGGSGKGTIERLRVLGPAGSDRGRSAGAYQRGTSREKPWPAR